MFNRNESPIEALLNTFSKNAYEMNAIQGFAGVLLLVGVLAFSIPTIADTVEVNGLYFISGISILASSFAYFAKL